MILRNLTQFYEWIVYKGFIRNIGKSVFDLPDIDLTVVIPPIFLFDHMTDLILRSDSLFMSSVVANQYI